MSASTGGRPAAHLVLAGGGHSHALALRRWAMNPRLRPAQTLITLVSRSSTALYSGALPALVAGLVDQEEARIDLRALAAGAEVCFVQAEIEGLDPGRRELRLRQRPPLRFDRLSLDVGAVTALPVHPAPVGFGEPVKPLEPFLAWLARQPCGQPVRIRGGGAAAVELALALRGRGLRPSLLLRGEGLRLGSRAANRQGERLLDAAAIAVRRSVPPEEPADLACTGSRAPAWLAAAGLPVEAGTGRVTTAPSLEVLGHPGLFAVGDCAVVAAAPRPASGVWAVRAAPVLADNLRRSLELPQRPLRRWRPQRRALQLLGDGGWSTAGPRAVAFWGPWAVGPSPWLWRWKRWIDHRFLQRLTPPAASPAAMAMACRGCAAKLAAAPLEAALLRLGGAPPLPEDAPVVTVTADGDTLLQSVDGFPALLDDPWLNARLTSLHACGDLWASGATVASAQVLVTLPEAAAALQEEWLLQTLAGVRSVLDPLGARLLGGHTLEGRDGAGLALALTVNGLAPAGRVWPKGPLRPGDALLLTGPLGSGVLFAAAMAGAAQPGWIDAALMRMQRSPEALLPLLAAHGCHACTDVTGFGLLGHLGEMLAAAPSAPLEVLLEGAALPSHAGALALLERGWASSLAPANARALALLDGPVRLLAPDAPAPPSPAGRPEAVAASPTVLRALLVDPQTCGPLLAALPGASAPAALAALHQAGCHDAALIARVRAAQPSPKGPSP